MIKRVASSVLAVIVCLSLSVHVFAANNTESHDEEYYFVPMSREEYITSKAAGQNISYGEAEAELDAKIAAAKAEIPNPMVWAPDTSVDNGDTTYTSYGRIYKVYTHASGLKMRYSVEAVKLRSYQGSMWIEINENSTWCQPEGNGRYTFSGVTTATMISKTQVRLAVTGYFEITKSNALAAGINIGLLSFSTSNGSEIYYRNNIDDHHIETA